MTLRKLWIRIKHLPRGSAFQRALTGDAARWGETEHLLAQLIDTLHAANGSDYRVPRPGSPEERAAAERAQRQADARTRGREAYEKRQRLALEGRAG
jgi:hypothetical protein